MCKADSPASEQKTDIKWVVLTLLSRQEALPVEEVHAEILIEVCASFLTELHRVSTLLCGFVLLELRKRMGGKMNLVQVKCPLSFSSGKDRTIVSLAQTFSLCNFLRDILSLIA